MGLLDERIGAPTQRVGPAIQTLGTGPAAPLVHEASLLAVAQHLVVALGGRATAEDRVHVGHSTTAKTSLQRFLCRLIFANLPWVQRRHTRSPSSRAMSMRCTSLVPSPISSTLASR